MSQPSKRPFHKLGRMCLAVAERPFLVLGIGLGLTICCGTMVLQAVISRSGADALAWGLVTTTCLTATMFGWIGAHIRKARPTPEQLLIQEVMDDLAMEEAATRAAERQQQRSADQPQTPPSAPWEKPADWWKGD